MTHSWEGPLHTWLLINSKGKDVKRQTISTSECLVGEVGYSPIQKTVPWVVQPTKTCSLRQRCTSDKKNTEVRKAPCENTDTSSSL